MTESTHPKTGLRYIYVIPRHRGTYAEYHRAYSRLANRIPWLRLVDLEDYGEEPEILEPGRFVVVWEDAEPSHRPWRESTVVRWYHETVGDPPLMIQHQRDMFQEMLSHAHRYAATLVHDPFSRDFLRRSLSSVHMIPSGYDPEAMGIPDWGAPKRHQIVTYGYRTGIREAILPSLEREMGGDLVDISGLYGQARQREINRARAVLFVPHSQGSFATFRLWQAAASSACLLTPRCDAWPATRGRHYLEVPEIRHDNVGEVAAALRACLEADLHSVAKAAHEDLSGFTTDKCVEDYLVPISELVTGRRNA